MNFLSDPFICIIYGPTAVGKTDLAERIAALLPVELINMDVGQLYTPLSIGTAKPDLAKSSHIHHLFNKLDDPVDFSVTRYREEITKLVPEIWSRGNLPVLVGGSGFYMRSLFFPPLERDSTGGDSTLKPQGSLWESLYAVDPVRAAAIRPSDTYRITRALQIWSKTGILPSLQKPQFNPVSPALILHVTCDRSELYGRINKRVEQMCTQGWLKEIQYIAADPAWSDFIKRKKLIGYDNLLSFLEQGGELESVMSAIAQRTRHYAKRQETYWRMFEKEVHSQATSLNIKTQSINLTLTSGDIDLYIKRLLYAYRNR